MSNSFQVSTTLQKKETPNQNIKGRLLPWLLVILGVLMVILAIFTPSNQTKTISPSTSQNNSTQPPPKFPVLNLKVNINSSGSSIVKGNLEVINTLDINYGDLYANISLELPDKEYPITNSVGQSSNAFYLVPSHQSLNIIHLILPNLKAKGNQTIPFEIPYSPHLSPGLYKVVVNVYAKPYIDLGQSFNTSVGLNGENNMLTVSNCQVSNGASQLSPNTSLPVAISPGSKALLVCRVENSNLESETVKYRIDYAAVSLDNYPYSEKLSQSSVEAITFNPKGQQLFSIPLPNISSPQLYDARLTFFDNQGQSQSIPQPFSWIVAGPSSSISNTIINKDYYSNGDMAKLNINALPSADFGEVGLINHSAVSGTIIKGASIQASIFDGSSKLCGQSSQDLPVAKNITSWNGQTMSINIQKDCPDPKVEVKISQDGQELANSQVKLLSKFIPKTNSQKISLPNYLKYPLLIFSLVLIVVGLLIKFRKPSTKAASLTIILLATLLPLSKPQSALAVVNADGTLYTPPGGGSFSLVNGGSGYQGSNSSAAYGNFGISGVSWDGSYTSISIATNQVDYVYNDKNFDSNQSTYSDGFGSGECYYSSDPTNHTAAYMDFTVTTNNGSTSTNYYVDPTTGSITTTAPSAPAFLNKFNPYYTNPDSGGSSGGIYNQTTSGSTPPGAIQPGNTTARYATENTTIKVPGHLNSVNATFWLYLVTASAYYGGYQCQPGKSCFNGTIQFQNQWGLCGYSVASSGNCSSNINFCDGVYGTVSNPSTVCQANPTRHICNFSKSTDYGSDTWSKCSPGHVTNGIDDDGNTCVVVPSVTTGTPDTITSNSAKGYGNVTSVGGDPNNVSDRGVDVSTSSSFVTSSYYSVGSGSTGAFSVNMTGLTCGTLYYARAYATNSAGTGYGSSASFNTIPCAPTTPSAANLACSGSPAHPNVKVSWTAPTYATYYKVYRGATILNSNVSSSPYTDSTGSTNTPYSYTIESCDTDGCSPQSNAASGKTFYCTPPNVTLSIPPPPGQTCLSPVGLGINSASATVFSQSGVNSNAVSYSIYDNSSNPKLFNGTLVGTITGNRNQGTQFSGTFQNTTQAFPTGSMVTGHTYYVIANATDVETNSSSSIPTSQSVFEFDANKCVDPYIKTQNGDVHSNQGISAPGGPQ